MYTLKSHIEERVPAWEECPYHNDIKEHPQIKCGGCNGSGGAWHELCQSGKWRSRIVTKSSFLVRRWGVCRTCHGSGDDTTSNPTERCDICQGTGAEPDTAGEWEVE